MINDLLKAKLAEECSRLAGMKIHINQLSPVHGGDINTCFKLETNGGDYFLKLNRSAVYPDMFQKEFSGLQALCRTRAISVPRPLITGTYGEHIYLITEFIHKDKPTANFWEIFAQNLAKLHQCTRNTFGFEEDNYIGTLPQSNRPHTSWAVFYGEERLYPLFRKAYEKQLIDHTVLVQAEQLYKKLDDIFPKEPPALLHGDLWGGNFMVGTNGEPFIFDPAVYYGHREMDLAMTRLFGGFDVKFYPLYDNNYPLEKGWQQRIGICQLYPLLVHLHLSGSSYFNAVKEILDLYL